LHEVVLPEASATEQVSRRGPSGNVEPDAGVQVTVPTPLQLSERVVEKVATAPLELVHGTLTATGHVSVGGVTSSTVTIEVHSDDNPVESVQVSVTECGPRPNGPVELAVQLGAGPSGSYEPPSRSASVTLAWQLAFASRVGELQIATGGWSGKPSGPI
jgi:hypothetical protein